MPEIITVYRKRRTHIFFVALYCLTFVLSVASILCAYMENKASANETTHLVQSLGMNTNGMHMWRGILLAGFLAVVSGILIAREINSYRSRDSHADEAAGWHKCGGTYLIINAVVMVILAVALTACAFLFEIDIKISFLLTVMVIILLSIALCLSSYLQVKVE